MTEPNPRPATSSEDAEALLETANSASQHVAVLHVAFMALCAYVLMIVFGTTDMDLLIGKGVKLPVVDVSVPIVGFYAAAPYLVFLVHFNLLLQLQLLSRKLYAFDAAAARLILPNFIHPSVHATSREERIGGLRDRLHIFPYTYYLVGRPGPIVRRLLAIMVGITLLVLPLATLLVLQLRFLAYQDQVVTWWQRVAVWFDVALVIALWPVIMDRGDRWRDYLGRLISRLRQRWRIGLAFAAVWMSLVLPGFVTSKEVYFNVLYGIAGLLTLVTAARALPWLVRRWRGRRREPEDAIPAAAPSVRGMRGFLLVVALGVPLPLGLIADGEWWGEEVLGRHVLLAEAANADWSEDGVLGRILLKYPVVASEVYDRFRRLDLSGQVLLAKPAKPERIAQFREGDPEKEKEALHQVEGLNLRGRSLRGALLSWALLPGANLRGAQLQGANLWEAQLQGTNLRGAQLQGANLRGAQLQGAYLREAQLQGANLRQAQLQGTNLRGAQLQGADLRGAQLQGANLRGAQLQGAYSREAQLQGANLWEAQLQGTILRRAQLQGAYLRGAQLQGADFLGAQLQGADLRFAELYGAIVEKSRTAFLDLRDASWTPLNEERLAEIREVLGKLIANTTWREGALEGVERAGKAGGPPPILESCLIYPEVTPGLKCQRQWLPAQANAFRGELFPVLEGLACQSSEIARGLIKQIDQIGPHFDPDNEIDVSDPTSGRFGLAGRFGARLDEQGCEGLSSLPKAEKDQIHELAKKEKEERRWQSAAGKPAE